eukprot:9186385-Pyramimonas_sp.AAC.1
MTTWANRYLMAAREKKHESIEYSLPYKNWAYLLRYFVLNRYADFAVSSEAPHALSTGASVDQPGTAGADNDA